MSILVNKDTKVIVQGFTGKEGSFHSEQLRRFFIAWSTQLNAPYLQMPGYAWGRGVWVQSNSDNGTEFSSEIMFII